MNGGLSNGFTKSSSSTLLIFSELKEAEGGLRVVGLRVVGLLVVGGGRGAGGGGGVVMGGGKKLLLLFPRFLFFFLFLFLCMLDFTLKEKNCRKIRKV